EQKMSKSLGNAIGVTLEPNDMFGKVMSIPDALMKPWYTLLTRESLDRVDTLCNPDKTHPRDAKLALAHIITQEMHGSEAAQAAQQAFTSVFAGGNLPEDIPEAPVELKD